MLVKKQLYIVKQNHPITLISLHNTQNAFTISNNIYDGTSSLKLSSSVIITHASLGFSRQVSPQLIKLLKHAPSSASYSVTPITTMSSFTASLNVLSGIPLLFLPDTSISSHPPHYTLLVLSWHTQTISLTPNHT